MTIDFDKYTEFVDAVTSDSSKDFVSLADRLGDLDRQGANIERLTTAAIGIAAEGGEFAEIVKKMVCLLYTSPSPRDATLSRMPSSA